MCVYSDTCRKFIQLLQSLRWCAFLYVSYKIYFSVERDDLNAVWKDLETIILLKKYEHVSEVERPSLKLSKGVSVLKAVIFRDTAIALDSAQFRLSLECGSSLQNMKVKLHLHWRTSAHKNTHWSWSISLNKSFDQKIQIMRLTWDCEFVFFSLLKRK